MTATFSVMTFAGELNTFTLSSQGCTKGPHNKEKPPEPVKPDVTSSGEKKEVDDQKPKFNEYIISAPKPQEAIRRPRYSWLQTEIVIFKSIPKKYLEILLFVQFPSIEASMILEMTEISSTLNMS